MKGNRARVSIGDLRANGVSLTLGEVLAVVETLLANGFAGLEPRRPLGPPSPDTVMIGEDGSVLLRGAAVTPVVFEIAILLHQLLPPGSPGVPGALHRTIARALREVIAPPFASLDDFARALGRFEQGDRLGIVKVLFARGASAPRPAATLGRQFRVIGLPFAAAGIAGLLLIGAGEAMHQSQSQTPPPSVTGRPPPPVVAPARAVASPSVQPRKAHGSHGLRQPPAANDRAGKANQGARKKPSLPSRMLARIKLTFEEP